MKAVLTEDRPSGDGWVFERKLDGIRCVAVKQGGRTALWSRNNLSLNGRFPEIAAALDAATVDDVLIDGEAVAFVGARDSFAGLARRGQEPAAVFYYAFDLVRAGGEDLSQLPLAERRARLETLLGWRDPLRVTEQMTGDGTELLARACAQGWEGLIAKRVESSYVQARSRDWLKLKCTREQELVIGGWTAPRGSRTDLGALLVGHFADGELRYAGKVGTGFDRATLRDLAERLAPLERPDSPFTGDGIPRHATWVDPVLVAQIGFSEWTRDGRLRHPRFIGLREDKSAAEVVREEP
jgi:bifunctional non-homologous end joining protein LigD